MTYAFRVIAVTGSVIELIVTEKMLTEAND